MISAGETNESVNVNSKREKVKQLNQTKVTNNKRLRSKGKNKNKPQINTREQKNLQSMKTFLRNLQPNKCKEKFGNETI